MAMRVSGLLLSVAILMAFLAISSLAVEVDEPYVLYASGDEMMGRGPCCDTCVCTRSIPPQCRCVDTKPYCHPSCKSCPCTRSMPPKCRCNDIKNYCDKPCKPRPLDHE